MNRRGFLGAILASGIAPAFVRPGILMPASPVAWLSKGQLGVLDNMRWIVVPDITRDAIVLRGDIALAPPGKKQILASEIRKSRVTCELPSCNSAESFAMAKDAATRALLREAGKLQGYTPLHQKVPPGIETASEYEARRYG